MEAESHVSKMEIGVWHCWQTGRRERSPAVGIRGTEDEEISAATRTNQILKVFPERVGRLSDNRVTEIRWSNCMHVEQWIVVLSVLGAALFGLAAILIPIRRLYLAIPAVALLLILVYEIRMDRWEKTVSAAIRLDMFAEVPLLALCLAFGMWQIVLSCKRKEI